MSDASNGDDGGRRTGVRKHSDLIVYEKAFETSVAIFEMSKGFPKEERYSLTDQVRRSSRSVCANLAEAWRKRRYEAAFVSKLTDCEAEAAETQVWLQFIAEHGYAGKDVVRDLYRKCDEVLAMLSKMVREPEKWCRLSKS